MPSDKLHTLLRLRQAALDEARANFAEALAREAAAEARRDAADGAIVTETRIAQSSAEDADVERFASWLKRGRAALEEAEAELAAGVAATTHMRAALSLARAASEAVSNAIDRRQQEQALADSRKTQREMDEIAQEVFRRASPAGQ